jgi:hypothetical protein
MAQFKLTVRCSAPCIAARLVSWTLAKEGSLPLINSLLSCISIAGCFPALKVHLLGSEHILMCCPSSLCMHQAAFESSYVHVPYALAPQLLHAILL